MLVCLFGNYFRLLSLPPLPPPLPNPPLCNISEERWLKLLPPRGMIHQGCTWAIKNLKAGTRSLFCLPMRSKAVHQTADKIWVKREYFIHSCQQNRREGWDISNRGNLLQFQTWTLLILIPEFGYSHRYTAHTHTQALTVQFKYLPDLNNVSGIKHYSVYVAFKCCLCHRLNLIHPQFPFAASVADNLQTSAHKRQTLHIGFVVIWMDCLSNHFGCVHWKRNHCALQRAWAFEPTCFIQWTFRWAELKVFNT